MIGAIELTNTSESACTIEGRPRVVILARNGRIAPTRYESFGGLFEAMMGGFPRWRGYPIVSLLPGQRTHVLFRWGNACHQSLPHAFRVTWKGVAWTANIQSPQAPFCNAPGQPSTLEVARFTPGWH